MPSIPAHARERAKQRIEEWMQRTGKRQVDLAESLGRSQGWVSKQVLSRGPGIDHLDAIADVIGCDPAELVLRDASAVARNLPRGQDTKERAGETDASVTRPDTGGEDPRFYAKGEHERVILALYRKLVELSPDEADAWFLMARTRTRSLEVEQDVLSRRPRADPEKRRNSS